MPYRSLRKPTTALLALTLAFGTLATFQIAASPADDGAGPVMQQFLAQSAGAQSYRAVRRLQATGRGQSAWLDARTNLTPGGGFEYEVTDEGGVGVHPVPRPALAA